MTTVICDWKTLRVGDHILNGDNRLMLPVTQTIDPKLAYQVLIGNANYKLKRQEEFIPVLRANNVLEGVAGALSPRDADAFWQNQSCSPLEWDAEHYDRTLPEKLAIMQQRWQQFCDRSEQLLYETRHTL